MNLIRIIKLNLRIISVLNSCDRKTFEKLINEVIDNPKVFRSKLYVWNIVRGRDFYKMLSHYVIEQFENNNDDPTKNNKVETIINMVMDTAKSEAIKRNFIWAIMKQVPLLTATTIQYASREKVISLLRSDKVLFTDPAIDPFVTEVYELRKQIKELEDQLQATQIMME